MSTSIVSDLVLLIEDDPRHADLFRMAWEDANLDLRLVVAGDADEALGLLQADGPTDLPGLVLLDLNLPGRDGCDILREIRTDARLMHLPVVVLTSSSSPRDYRIVRDLGGDAFVTKPLRYEDLVSEVLGLADRWFPGARHVGAS